MFKIRVLKFKDNHSKFSYRQEKNNIWCRKQENTSVTIAISTSDLKTQAKSETQFAMKRHYANMPIQIYRKFHLQKLKIFK